MIAHTFIVVALLISLGVFGSPTPKAPGTTSRPVLSTSEAAKFTKAMYLGNWSPGTLEIPTTAHYTVGPSGTKGVTHTTIQTAVNAAIKAGGSTRQYINILPGTYMQPVYIPSSSVPVTLYGSGSDSSEVVITMHMSAASGPGIYGKQVQGLFKEGDPAYSMYETCIQRLIGTIGNCASVVWSNNENLELINLSIFNTATDDQAIALRVEGDRTHLENVRLIGHQGTFFAGSTSVRIYVSNSYISGDVDFVFGQGRVVFENVHFHSRADRVTVSYVLAPDTLPDDDYGFLVVHSRFTSDSYYHKNRTAELGRAWDASAVEYIAGKTSNGQAVVRDSHYDYGFSATTPWGTTAGGRKFSGNVKSDRNLNDSNYNRMWEYNTSSDDR